MIYKSSHIDLDKSSPILGEIHDRHVAELRSLLKELYDQLRPEQQNVIHLMYTSLDNIKEEQLAWAICQCENTIIKNSKGAA